VRVGKTIELTGVADGRRIRASLFPQNLGRRKYERLAGELIRALPVESVAASPSTKLGDTLVGEGAGFRCHICGFEADDRVVVFDHIKHSHRDIVDRNAEIENVPRRHA
jgi:hypothetical protein